MTEEEDDPLIAYPDDPSTDKVHQPYTAMCQGFTAREENLNRSLNPYLQSDKPELDCWAWAWDEGWQEADDQDRPLPNDLLDWWE